MTWELWHRWSVIRWIHWISDELLQLKSFIKDSSFGITTASLGKTSIKLDLRPCNSHVHKYIYRSIWTTFTPRLCLTVVMHVHWHFRRKLRWSIRKKGWKEKLPSSKTHQNNSMRSWYRWVFVSKHVFNFGCLLQKYNLPTCAKEHQGNPLSLTITFHWNGCSANSNTSYELFWQGLINLRGNFFSGIIGMS